ncbi:MAG: hypothetical protein QOD66_1102, partial [Solirubrobacteraceae bacterium]|nr:hypothetical protein [Solirubrobacteraceae bacterium]
MTTAFNVGWLLAELATRGESSGKGTDGRAGASALSSPMPNSTLVRQIQAKLNQLEPDLRQAGLPDVLWGASENGNSRQGPAAALFDALAQALGEAIAAVPREHGSGKERASGKSRSGRHARAKSSADADTPAIGADPDRRADDVAKAVRRLERLVQEALTTADTRLGKAYGLGFDLANMCRMPAGVVEDPFADLFGKRLIAVEQALADLSSSLPDHAARAVSLSLARWKEWADRPRLSKQDVEWPHDGVQTALERQGQVWRSLLCGEKLGKDMLRAEDYVTAGKSLTWRLIKSQPWILAVAVAVVALVAVGIYFLVGEKGTASKVLGSGLTALGAVGISTASAKRFVANIAQELEAQVWGAELDFAIADAITVPPGDWGIKARKIDLPPARGLDPAVARNSRQVHLLGKAIRIGRVRKIRGMLHDNCKYEPLSGKRVKKSGRVAYQLVLARSLATHPRQLVAGRPGRLASLHEGNNGDAKAHVWTFDGAGKIARL